MSEGRSELKYALPPQARRAVLQEAAPFVQPDPNADALEAQLPRLRPVSGLHATGYRVSSLYLDDPQLDGYLRGGLRAAAGGGVELCCDRRFEADIYRMDLSGIWARLSELRCPVHIWCGGESRHMDALGPGGSTEALYAKMAGAAAGAATRSSAGGGAVPLEVLGGLGHFGPLEDPGRFAKCLWERAGGQESTIRSRL